MAYLTLLEADLRRLARSWVVRIWLILTFLFAFLIVLSAPGEGLPASQALANLLGTYPLIWSTFVIAISAGAVSSQAGVLADGILSKAVTRYDYLLAKLSAHLLAVWSIYLLVVLPAAYLLTRYAVADDLSARGAAWALLVVGAILFLLTALGVAFSTLFNRTLVAVVVLWLLWYAASTIFALLEVEYLSPLTVVEGLPAVIQGDYVAGDQWQLLAGFGLPAFLFLLLAVVYFARKDL